MGARSTGRASADTASLDAASAGSVAGGADSGGVDSTRLGSGSVWPGYREYTTPLTKPFEEDAESAGGARGGPVRSVSAGFGRWAALETLNGEPGSSAGSAP